MKANRIILFCLSILLFAGCATQMNVTASQTKFQINTLALMPGGGILADAIGTSLLKYNISVIDTSSLSSIMIRDNLNEAELMLPTNLVKLKEKGIDAVLNVRTVAGYDGKPQSASFRLVSTENGMIVCGGSWNNAAAGAQGSIADAAARRDLSFAAEEISSGIAKALSL